MFTLRTCVPGDCEGWVGQTGQPSQDNADPQLSYLSFFLPGDCDGWVGQAGQPSQYDVDPQLGQVGLKVVR